MIRSIMTITPNSADFHLLTASERKYYTSEANRLNLNTQQYIEALIAHGQRNGATSVIVTRF